jgi:hypothetical protein
LLGLKTIQRRLVTSLSVLLLIASSHCVALGRHQTDSKSPSIPTLDRILDRYEAAVGGRKAWDKLTSRVIKGTMVISSSGQVWILEVYQQDPDKYLNVTTIPPQHKIELGFNGVVGWSKDSVQGARKLTGLQLDMAKHMSLFNEEVKLRDAFPKMEFLGTERIDGRNSYAVRTTTAEGYTGTMYFDTESGLRVRVTSTNVKGQTYDDFIEKYCDLPDPGIKYPCQRREVYPTFTVTVRYGEIRHNVAIDQSLFVPPSFEYKIQH